MNRSAARIFALLPAAGLSVRMGQPKLLLPWQGRTVIEQSIDNFRAAGVEQVYVTLRPDAPAELHAAAIRAGGQVVPADAPEDMKASLLIGLKAMQQAQQPRETDAWIVAPADLPALEPRVIRQVVAAYDPNRPRCVLPRYGTRRGHPVLLPWNLAEDLKRLPVDAGLDAVVRSAATTEVLLVDAASPHDLDTPEDYRRALAAQSRAN